MDPFDRAGKRGNDKNFAVGKGLALRFELALLVTFLDLVAHTVMSHFRFHFKQLPFLGLDYPRKNCKSELPVFFPKRLTREKAHLNFSSSI